MDIVTLLQIKQNSRILGDDENDVLEQIGDTAEAIVQNIMNRDFESLIDEYGAIPAPIVRAILVLADHLYTHRGVCTPSQVYSIPYSIDVMVKPYSKLG